MGQDGVLQCETHSEERMKPKFVPDSSSGRRKKIQERERKEQHGNRYHYLKRLDGDFRELSRSYSANIHYESMHSLTLGAGGDNEVLKRGSMYQSSEEVRRMRKLKEGMRKVETSGTDDAFISFEIVGNLPQHGSNKANLSRHQKYLPLAGSTLDSKPSTYGTINSIGMSSKDFLDLSFRDLPDKPVNANSSVPVRISLVDDFLEIHQHSSDKHIHCTKTDPKSVEAGLPKVQNPDFHERIGSQIHANIIYERDSVKTLPKCFSESAKMSHTVSKLQYGTAEARVSKTMLSPLKKVLVPIMKSKSIRDLPPSQLQNSGSTVIDPTDIGRSVVSQKSLPDGLHVMEDNIKRDACLVEGELLAAAISPVHLHGILMLDAENGNPSFQFSLQNPEEVLSSKTWKTDNAFNWVYSFHSSKKKSCSSQGIKAKHGNIPPLIGQMQVSCYLCSEVRENGSLANSTVMDFVLYDIARARRSFAVEEKSNFISDSTKHTSNASSEVLVTAGALERENSVDYPNSARVGFSSRDSNTSTSYPWSPEDLHPKDEIAAIVIQIPFNKKESPKVIKELKENQHVSRCPKIGQLWETKKNLNPGIVKVVTPSGNHGLPITDETGPSSLLDRWRFGGRCDCGGWDMACPIVVFDNHHDDDRTDQSTREFQNPFLLFVQGSKEKIPALTIMADGKGQYSVDFHAQLSALQAFSICIAILHASEVSAAVLEKGRQRLHHNSLKLLLEEEVRHFIDRVGSEEQRLKAKEGVAQMPTSFFLDPPFSPMSRV